jgi:hypothetical protein
MSSHQPPKDKHLKEELKMPLVILNTNLLAREILCQPTTSTAVSLADMARNFNKIQTQLGSSQDLAKWEEVMFQKTKRMLITQQFSRTMIISEAMPKLFHLKAHQVDHQCLVKREHQSFRTRLA